MTYDGPVTSWPVTVVGAIATSTGTEDEYFHVVVRNDSEEPVRLSDVWILSGEAEAIPAWHAWRAELPVKVAGREAWQAVVQTARLRETFGRVGIVSVAAIVDGQRVESEPASLYAPR